MSQKRPILLLPVLLRAGNFIRQVCGILDFLRMYCHCLLLYAFNKAPLGSDALLDRLPAAAQSAPLRGALCRVDY